MRAVHSRLKSFPDVQAVHAHDGLAENNNGGCGPYNDSGVVVKVKTRQQQTNRTGVLIHRTVSK